MAGQVKYDHKIIAILPMKTAFIKYASVTDSSIKEYRALELKYGVELQEALYHVITADTNRLLVAVQPWEVTDSILKRAGVDFLKLPYLNMVAIARLLKVDACIVTTVNPIIPMRGGARGAAIGGTPLAALAASLASGAASQGLTNLMTKGNKNFYYTLVDGKSGEDVWSLSDEVSSEDLALSKEGIVCSHKMFWRFKKRFPYCD